MYVAELTPVVCEENGKNVTERESGVVHSLFQELNPHTRFCRCLVLHQNAEHEIHIDKLKGHDDLPADSSDHGIHFHNIEGWIFRAEREEIVISSAHADPFRHLDRAGGSTRFELHRAGKIHPGDGVVPLLNVAVHTGL